MAVAPPTAPEQPAVLPTEFLPLVDSVVELNSQVFGLHLGIARAMQLHAVPVLHNVGNAPGDPPTAVWETPLLGTLMREGTGVFATWEGANKKRRGVANPHFCEDVAASIQLIQAAARYCRLTQQPAPDTLVFVTILMRFTE